MVWEETSQVMPHVLLDIYCLKEIFFFLEKYHKHFVPAEYQVLLGKTKSEAQGPKTKPT